MPPGDTEIVYESTVDVLFRRALKSRMTERCRARLKEAGIDVDAPLKPKYPRLTFIRGLTIVSEELFPDLPRDKALFEVGGLVFTHFTETVVGRTALTIMKILGPRRTLNRMTESYRSSNNFMEARVTERAPTHVELWLSQCSGVPTYYLGGIYRAFTLMGVQGLDVRVKLIERDACVLAISWQEK